MRLRSVLSAPSTQSLLCLPGTETQLCPLGPFLALCGLHLPVAVLGVTVTVLHAMGSTWQLCSPLNLLFPPCPLAKPPDVPTSMYVGCQSSHGAGSLPSSSIWSLISLWGSSSSCKRKPSLRKHFDSTSVLVNLQTPHPCLPPISSLENPKGPGAEPALYCRPGLDHSIVLAPASPAFSPSPVPL